ncbi:hypothetical protein O6H91_06G028500 [Diphasiastrum complanatum]|nr:hypothetical protein O6H91_06G028500 [Diphasiastrum complanatum]
MEEGHETEMANFNTEKSLALFFKEVEGMKIGMDRIRHLLLKLQDANDESKTIHKVQPMKALRDWMEDDVQQVLKLAKFIKGKLEELDGANAANRKLPGCGEGTSTERTRTSVTNSQRKKLKNLMADFQLLRERMVGEYRQTIERRYYTVTGQQPDDQTIEKIIETGQSENFFQTAIQEQGRGQVIEIIHEIQERHDTIKGIQRDLLELHGIFLDMAVLVESQEEPLNSIEEQVKRASSVLTVGARHLQTAKKRQRNKRKCTCIAIILLLIIILVVVVTMVVSLKKKK